MVTKFKYLIVYPDGKLKEVKEELVLYELYYKLARTPTLKELGKKYNKKYLDELKRNISERDEYVPLCDIYSKNIYLISKNKIKYKITNNHFRLPDEYTVNIIQKELERITKIIAEKGNVVPSYYMRYAKKLRQQIVFLNCFDINILTKTFYRIFYENNPSTEDVTTCRKPSFWPFLRNTPYYSKKELYTLALNMGIKINADNFVDTCHVVSVNDIDAKILNAHMVYIKNNNIKSFIQMYTFIGSFFYNTYLRNNSFKDVYIEKQILNLWYIIRKAPAFNNSYYFYRFVADDSFLSHLKVGDIYEENSFMSTTRNPFYNPKNNIFGYVLIKINVPMGIEGVGLCLESFSFFRDEQEILLAPCRLKLKSLNSRYTYYHTNPVASEKISKRYEFDYIEPIIQSPLNRTRKYTPFNQQINKVDFKSLNVHGDDIVDKMIYFYESVTTKLNSMRYFFSDIGSRQYLFQVHQRQDYRIYDKYFFLQNFEHIYFVVQDDFTNEILLLMEIRERISVNYIFKFIGNSSPFDETDFLDFISYVAKSFGVKDVIIHDNYESYAKITEQNLNDNSSHTMDFDNPDTHIQNLQTGASKFYPKDLIGYLLSISNYNYKDTDNTYIPRFDVNGIEPFLKKKEIANLGNIPFIKITDITLNTPINKIFIKFNKEYGLENIIDFYVYLHFHYFYLIIELNSLLMHYFNYNLDDINPWDTNFYILSPDIYLFENNSKETYIDIPDSEKSDVAMKLRVGKKIKSGS